MPEINVQASTTDVPTVPNELMLTRTMCLARSAVPSQTSAGASLAAGDGGNAGARRQPQEGAGKPARRPAEGAGARVAMAKRSIGRQPGAPAAKRQKTSPTSERRDLEGAPSSADAAVDKPVALPPYGVFNLPARSAVFGAKEAAEHMMFYM